MPEVSDTEVRQAVRSLIAQLPDGVDTTELRGRLFDAGLALVQFPEGKGGLGAEPKLQTVVHDELRDAGLPADLLWTNPIGIGMGMPTVLAHGSEAMHQRLLRPCFTGEETWCQMFSEPGAGSDVAGLATRAVRDGDEWVVSGQKVWTTLAHVSRWGMIVARTDPSQPKHRGLTYFLVDMTTPGIEIRPLMQMTGEAEFNEVFLSEVRIPDSMRLGEVGEGWRVAITTLMNERVALGGGGMPRGGGPIGLLVDLWQQRRDELGPAGSAARRDEVVRRWVEAEVLRLTSLRAQAQASAGTPGPSGSIGKLASAELNQRIFETAIDLCGADGLVFEAGYPLERARVVEFYTSDVKKAFLRSRANSIEGGTSEVMRNILGERVLGLPGDVRVDKDAPWSDVARN